MSYKRGAGGLCGLLCVHETLPVESLSDDTKCQCSNNRQWLPHRFQYTAAKTREEKDTQKASVAVDLSYLSATPLPSEETKRKTEEIKEGEKNKEGGTKGKK